MRLRSLDDLRLDRARARVLHQVRQGIMDVPDRLPFEVADRFWGDRPLGEDHQVQPVQRVPATKPGQSTVRPFVRVHPEDFLLYQALVDAMRDQIEDVLGDRSEAFAYRLSELSEDDPYEGTPRWGDFREAMNQMALDEFSGYVIEGDVASFYLNINLDELQRRLLEAGCGGPVVRDLGGLLEGWAAQGIRGLPQGVPPSSPLANFYLAPLDELLRDRGVVFARYMDDLAVVCSTFHEARQLLDDIEDLLYEDGLSLGGGKTWISRAERVVARLTPGEALDEQLAELADVGDYAPGEEEIEEIRVDQICALFDEAVAALERDEYKREEFTFAFRQLGAQRHPHAIEHVPQVLLRLPGMTPVACRYLERLATDEHREAVAKALGEIATREFQRSQEWCHILRAIQVLPNRSGAELAETAADLADGHDHPLVRARALLAWGAQSDPDSFELADRFFEREDRPWLAYAVVAIQGKDRDGRDERYAKWTGEGRGLARLTESVEAERFAWSKI